MSPGSAEQVQLFERRDKALRGCEGIIGKHTGHPAYAILGPESQVRLLLTKPNINQTGLQDGYQLLIELPV